MEFLSTPSGWRATKVLVLRKLLELFLSTPSGWRATGIPCKINTVLFDFYPRPPGGGRPPYPIFSGTVCLFLSTPSGWRATFPPERQTLNSEISIHALRVEGDAKCVSPEADVCIFLSTPSGWRATGCMRFKDLQAKISIHALRVEGDHVAPETGRRIEIFLSTPSGWRATYNSGYAFAARRYFYPRPPGGGRQNFRSCPTCRILFLSTPSGWRATDANYYEYSPEELISIHALRVEGDRIAA